MSPDAFSFDEPQHREVRIGGAVYTLREPTGDDRAAWCRTLLQAIQLATDGRPAGVDFGYLAEIVARQLRDGTGKAVPLAVVNSWLYRIVRKLFVALLKLDGVTQAAPAPLTAGGLYIWCLTLWLQTAGSQYPALAAKMRTILDDPASTEAAYADLIGEVNRVGGPKIGVPIEASLPITPSVAQQEAAILKAMLRHDPARTTVTDLTAEVCLGERSIRHWLQKMEQRQLPLVSTPTGKDGRKLTDTGREVARALPAHAGTSLLRGRG